MPLTPEWPVSSRPSSARSLRSPASSWWRSRSTSRAFSPTRPPRSSTAATNARPPSVAALAERGLGADDRDLALSAARLSLRVRRQLNERGRRIGRDELAEGDENLDGSGRRRPDRALIEFGLALVEKGRGAVAPRLGLGDVLEAGADLEQRELLARVHEHRVGDAGIAFDDQELRQRDGDADLHR